MSHWNLRSLTVKWDFFFSTFWKIKSSRIQKWWENTRVVWTGGSRAGAAPRTLCLCRYFVSSFFYYDSMNNVFLNSFYLIYILLCWFCVEKNVNYIVLDGWKYPVRYDWVNCWGRDSLIKVDWVPVWGSSFCVGFSLYVPFKKIKLFKWFIFLFLRKC